MPNCDWGKPCVCRECRTKVRVDICDNCGFENVVKIVGSGTIKVGPKGLSYPDITDPKGDDMNLTCYKCKKVMIVPFYTTVSESDSKENLTRDKLESQAKPCSMCGENIVCNLGKYSAIELTEYKGKQLCKECYVNSIRNDTEDPTNEKEKYIFNNYKMKWELDKVRVVCELCGRPRWLKPENIWKTMCKSCYFTSQE